jgi:hypothetical protein
MRRQRRREPGARCEKSQKCVISSAPTRCRSTSLAQRHSNLLGLDRWVRSFSYVTYYDGWDGVHPRVFTPKHKPYMEFESGEEINNWLLVNPEVRAHMSRPAPPGQRLKVAMVFFDAETERICEELGYDLILPSAELREHLDSKLVTTRLGNEVGAASVPNVLVTVDEYDELLEAARSAGLGTDLVVQTAYGDSGKTTFFVDSENRVEAARARHQRQCGQSHEADQQPPRGRRSRSHSQRHDCRTLHVRANRALRAHPLPRRLLRQ